MNPEANELAALLDGRLSPTARERVLGQLAASPELSAVYADAILALREQEAEAASQRVVDVEATAKSARGKNPTNSLVLIGWAAAAVLMVSTVLVMRESVLSRSELGPPSATVALLDHSSVDGPIPVDMFTITRGSSSVAESPSGRAIRIGTLLALAELQLAAKDSLAGVTLERAAQSFDSVPAGSPVAASLRSIARSPGNPESGEALARASDAAERFVDARAMRVGAWLTAMRVAALQKDSQFVRAAESSGAIGVLRELADNAVTDSRQQALGEVSALESELSRPTIDWYALDIHATALIRILGH